MPLYQSWLDGVFALLGLTFAGGLGLVALTAAAYLGKSALGINLLEGRSPLHDVLYWLLV